VSKLDDLLKKIAPQITIDPYLKKLDVAINTFDFPKIPVKSEEHFKDVLGDFYWHIQNKLIKFTKYYKPKAECKTIDCKVILDKLYKKAGHKDGIWVAYDLIRVNAEGGFYEFFKKLGNVITNKEIDNHITYKVEKFIKTERHNFNNFSTIVDEYVRKYNHILPPELIEDNAISMKDPYSFKQVLKQHPYCIKGIQDKVKYNAPD